MSGEAIVAAPSTSPRSSSRYALWAGRVIYALVVAFLAFDGITKAMKLEPIVQATTQFGYPEGAVFGIGLTPLVCTVIYTVPHMAFLGTILLSGYLGGAIATQMRAEDPWFVFQPYRVVAVGRALLARWPDPRARLQVKPRGWPGAVLVGATVARKSAMVNEQPGVPREPRFALFTQCILGLFPYAHTRRS